MADFFIFKTALRDLVRAKRVFASLLLIAAPAAISLLWRFAASDLFDPYDAYNTLSSVVVYGFLLVILSVVFGTGVISQEIEQKTIVYLLTRPVPRWRIVIVKFLAAVVGIVVTVLAATLLLAGVTFLGGGEASSVIRRRDVRDHQEFVQRLRAHDDVVADYLYKKLDPRTRELVDNKFDAPSPPPPPAAGAPPPGAPAGPGERRNVIRLSGRPRRPNPERVFQRALDKVNQVLETDAGFYSDERFGETYVDSNPELKLLFAEHPKSGPRLARFNRLLMEAFYPDLIAPRATPTFPLKRDLVVLPVGAVAYAALFLLLATILNRPLMYGLVFAFGWESWVPNLPGKFSMVSIMTYLRALAPHPQPAAESVDLVQFLSGGAETVISQGLARIVLICIIALALGLALVIFSKNEYVPREDAE